MKTITVTYENDDGKEVDINLPAIAEVCNRCGGTGKHSNPSIDGNGITGSEWEEWDEDDKESYMSGAWDIPCETCEGTNVVWVIDDTSLTGEEKKAYEQYCEERLARACEREEARMEERYCGGY